MFVTQHLIIFIMSRGDFQAPCTKLNIDIGVFDDWNLSVGNRNNNFFAMKMRKSFIVGMHSNSCISHYCFWSCSGNGYCLIAIGNLIFDGIQFALFFLIYHLFVGKRRLCFWIPVYHSITSIDKTTLI